VDLNQRKEQFSNAYVRAIASVAGFTLAKPEVDDDSIDFMLAQRGGGGTVRSPRVELQLKCTERYVMQDGNLPFPLKIKNYNDLRTAEVLVPRILVVLYVPDDLSNWISHSQEDIVLRHCGYWASLRGLPAVNNAGSVTVHIPQDNQFTPEALTGIMQRIGAGELP
jgi:hypothetical protein